MPLLESLIGLTQRGGRRDSAEKLVRHPGGERGFNSPHFDGSLTAAGEDTWTPSGDAAPGEAELVRGRKARALEPGADGARKECGNVFCRTVWTPPWKSREYPIFEGRWACSPGCAEALVRSALARETGEWPEDDMPLPHRHRIPLGLVLLAHGWVTHTKLQRALEAQRANGCGRIGEWLIAESGVSAEEVTRGLSAQWNCPVLTLDGFSPQTTALALPRVLIEEYGALPLRVAGGKVLYVGFRDQLDAASSFAIEQMSGLKTESGVMGEANFRRAQERLLDSRFPEVSIAEEADRDTLSESVAAMIGQTRPTASRLLKLHRYYWLRIWNSGAECRLGSTLPMSVDAVSDYLFTIARHTAAGLRQGTSETPVDARRNYWRFDSRIDIQADEAVDAATEPFETKRPIAAAGPEQSAEPDIAKSAAFNAADRMKPGYKTKVEFVAEPAAKLRPKEAALTVFDGQAFEVIDAKKPVLTRDSVWDGSNSSQRPAERIARVEADEEVDEAEMETIEGEYMPLDSVPDKPVEPSATGFLFLHRRSDWRQFQAWSQRSLSFLRRGANPASGPNQEG